MYVIIHVCVCKGCEYRLLMLLCGPYKNHDISVFSILNRNLLNMCYEYFSASMMFCNVLTEICYTCVMKYFSAFMFGNVPT